MNETGRSQRHIRKGPQDSLYIKCLSLTPASSMKTPQNMKENPDDYEPVDEADIQMEYSCN